MRWWAQCSSALSLPSYIVLETKSQTSGCMRQDTSRKHAAVGRDGVGAVEQVLEHRGAGADRVGALGDVRELLGVAEQHHRVGALGRSRSRRRARPGRPRRPAGRRLTERRRGVPTTRRCRRGASPALRSRRGRTCNGSSRSSTRRRCSAVCASRGSRKPGSSAASSIAASRLLIALCAVAITPTRRPASISASASRRRSTSCPNRAGPAPRARSGRARGLGRTGGRGRPSRSAVGVFRVEPWGAEEEIAASPSSSRCCSCGGRRVASSSPLGLDRAQVRCQATYVRRVDARPRRAEPGWLAGIAARIRMPPVRGEERSGRARGHTATRSRRPPSRARGGQSCPGRR